MTEKQIYKKLEKILDVINENEYPEIYGIILNNIDADSEELYNEPFFIAELLHEADGAKKLPKCVSELLMEIYEDELANGNANAACDIGSLYYSGRAGEQSYKKALEYYTVAADGGCRQAQENLGYCYYYGRDTAVDYEKAFHYFALGAFDGNIRSLYKIGDMYRNGYYVNKNAKEAFYIYKRCLYELNEGAMPFVGADVMMRVADCYFEGIGTEKNYLLALEYYQKAENLFYERLQDGDFLIKGCYEKVIARQAEVREELKKSLPDYEWTNK